MSMTKAMTQPMTPPPLVGSLNIPRGFETPPGNRNLTGLPARDLMAPRIWLFRLGPFFFSRSFFSLVSLPADAPKTDMELYSCRTWEYCSQPCYSLHGLFSEPDEHIQ